MDSKETTAAAQLAPVMSTRSILPLKSEPVRPVTEYGCVDWYPFLAPESRAEWFEEAVPG